MFVGRDEELRILQELYDKARGGFQLAVVYGRRRVGKTALLERFSGDKPTLFFTAQIQSDVDNLRDFTAAVAAHVGLPDSMPSFASWRDALRFVAQAARGDHLLLVFDEFPYAAASDASLPSALQVAIDHDFKGTNCLMVLCGSDQGFMESKVLGEKSPLYGRRSAQLKLLPFDYLDAARMMPACPPQERMSYYAGLGGTPYYLAALDPTKGYVQNMTALFFDRTGLMFEEPSMLLRQELREPAVYSSVMRALANGATRSNQIADRASVSPSSITAYLKTLIDLGIVERVVPHGEPSKSRRSIYRIADPAFSFWYRFVAPYVTAVENGLGSQVAERLLSGSRRLEYEGHVFERICREWVVRQARKGALPLTVTNVGSWWGTDPVAHEQADIDVVASDEIEHDVLLGECKWRNSVNVSEAVSVLQARSSLMGRYHRQWLYLFTKARVGEDVAQRRTSDDIRLVCAEDMYDG